MFSGGNILSKGELEYKPDPQETKSLNPVLHMSLVY